MLCLIILLTQADLRYDSQAMADPSLTDDTVGLLAEEARPGGQALRLGSVVRYLLFLLISFSPPI